MPVSCRPAYGRANADQSRASVARRVSAIRRRHPAAARRVWARECRAPRACRDGEDWGVRRETRWGQGARTRSGAREVHRRSVSNRGKAGARGQWGRALGHRVDERGPRWRPTLQAPSGGPPRKHQAPGLRGQGACLAVPIAVNGPARGEEGVRWAAGDAHVHIPDGMISPSGTSTRWLAPPIFIVRRDLRARHAHAAQVDARVDAAGDRERAHTGEDRVHWPERDPEE